MLSVASEEGSAAVECPIEAVAAACSLFVTDRDWGIKRGGNRNAIASLNVEKKVSQERLSNCVRFIFPATDSS